MKTRESNRLADPVELEPLVRKNNLRGLVQLSIHAGLIVLAGWGLGAATHWAVQCLMSMLLGIGLVFVFAPLHESIHKTAFRTRRLNAVVGGICGFIILLPPRYFQAFHMAHHRFTQVEGKDPELDVGKPETGSRYLWHVSGLPYWIGQVRTLCRLASGNADIHYIHRAKRPAVIREARGFLLGYTAVFTGGMLFGLTEILVYWVIPVLVGQPFLRLFLLAEHTLCPTDPNMLENTRTTVTNPLVRFLCWNMCYHVEHHVWPSIPFHQLARAHRLARPHIHFLATGYFSVNRQILHATGRR